MNVTKLSMSKIKNTMLPILLLFVTALIFLLDNNDNLRFWSIYGTAIAVVLGILLTRIQGGKIVTPINLFFAFFCLFQFGIPMILAFNNDYTNGYLRIFNSSIIAEAEEYTVFCMIVACLALIISYSSKKDKQSTLLLTKVAKNFDNYRACTAQAGLVLFILTAVIALPVLTIAVYKQISSGIYTTAYRGALSDNYIFKFCQEFFYSSAFLVWIYSENKGIKKLVRVLYLMGCISMLLLADRAQGLVGLFIYFYYSSYSEKKKERDNIFSWKFLMAIISCGLIMMVISNTRSGYSINFGIGAVIENIVGEFGFNFTSICFVMDYVPSIDYFKYGETYLFSFIKLIPSSLDFMGLLSSGTLGEQWLLNMNNIHGREYLSFGVGFSLIAESFLNFGWWGLIAIFLVCYIVGRLLNGEKDCLWCKYSNLIIMFTALMLPRRQFASILKSWEYGIFFMAIYTYIYISLTRKGQKNGKY